MSQKVVDIVLDKDDVAIAITSNFSLSLPKVSQGVLQLLEQLDPQLEYWIFFTRSTQDLAGQFSIFQPFLKHHNTMITAAARNTHYVSEDIGYVEDGPFLTEGQAQIFPTWQMVDRRGVFHSSLLRQLPKSMYHNVPDFAY